MRWLDREWKGFSSEPSLFVFLFLKPFIFTFFLILSIIFALALFTSSSNINKWQSMRYVELGRWAVSTEVCNQKIRFDFLLARQWSKIFILRFFAGSLSFPIEQTGVLAMQGHQVWLIHHRQTFVDAILENQGLKMHFSSCPGLDFYYYYFFFHSPLPSPLSQIFSQKIIHVVDPLKEEAWI